jgi:hypothetical protein
MMAGEFSGHFHLRSSSTTIADIFLDDKGSIL